VITSGHDAITRLLDTLLYMQQLSMSSVHAWFIGVDLLYGL